MNMVRGIFCGTTAQTNEVYRAELKNKNKWLTALAIIGLACAAAAFLVFYFEIIEITSYMLGVYCGLGFGLFLGFTILIVHNVRLLHNEEKLKQERLKYTDERLNEIGNKALKTTAFLLILFLLAGGMIGGLFYPVLVKALLVVLWVFLITYFIAFKIYEKKM